MISWPQDLVEDIARRRSVLFLGAGVSKNSRNDAGDRPPDWRQFLDSLSLKVTDAAVRGVIAKCMADGDFLAAAEVAKNALHADVVNTTLLSEFAQKRFQPSAIHQELVAIDSRLVLTTNFDKLYDIAVNQTLHGDVVVKNYTDTDVADTLRRQIRCVLKVHGTIDAPGTSILTRSDYARARNLYASFYRVLDALFITHTFCFIGVSLSDPDVRLLLEDYAWRYPGSRPHYVITPEAQWHPSMQAVLEGSMNLRVIPYDSTDNHAELNLAISDLRKLVERERAGLVTTLNW